MKANMGQEFGFLRQDADPTNTVRWIEVKPVIDLTVRKLCTHAYPGHPRGCPNYGRRPTCPPAARIFHDLFDIEAEVWAIWNRFDLAAHVERMRTRHPEWSERQLRCCLYWQNTARKQLKSTISNFHVARMTETPLAVTRCPEAMGVDVTTTMMQAGIALEWPPKRWVYQIALAGQERWRKL